MIAARTFVTATTGRQNGAGFHVDGVDADREATQNVFVQAQLTFQFGNRSGRCVDGQLGVVTLAVFLDAISDGAQAPLFGFFDLATVIGDHGRHHFGQTFDLLCRKVLACDEHAFIKSHIRLLSDYLNPQTPILAKAGIAEGSPPARRLKRRNIRTNEGIARGLVRGQAQR